MGADSVLGGGLPRMRLRVPPRPALDGRALQGTREPRLRTSASPDRWSTVWVDVGDESALQSALQSLQRQAGVSSDARVTA